MVFNLEQIFQAAKNLDCLEDPFNHEEINAVIQSMPFNKAPGPVDLTRILLKNVGP